MSLDFIAYRFGPGSGGCDRCKKPGEVMVILEEYAELCESCVGVMLNLFQQMRDNPQDKEIRSIRVNGEKK